MAAEVSLQLVPLVELSLFRQILDLDEIAAQHDFSKPLVQDFFDQAEVTVNLLAKAW